MYNEFEHIEDFPDFLSELASSFESGEDRSIRRAITNFQIAICYEFLSGALKGYGSALSEVLRTDAFLSAPPWAKASLEYLSSFVAAIDEQIENKVVAATEFPDSAEDYARAVAALTNSAAIDQLKKYRYEAGFRRLSAQNEFEDSREQHSRIEYFSWTTAFETLESIICGLEKRMQFQVSKHDSHETSNAVEEGDFNRAVRNTETIANVSRFTYSSTLQEAPPAHALFERTQSLD